MFQDPLYQMLWVPQNQQVQIPFRQQLSTCTVNLQDEQQPCLFPSESMPIDIEYCPDKGIVKGGNDGKMCGNSFTISSLVQQPSIIRYPSADSLYGDKYYNPMAYWYDLPVKETYSKEDNEWTALQKAKINMERFSGRVKECSSFGYCLFGLFLIIVIVMCIVMVTRSNESYTIQKKVDQKLQNKL